jgi:anaerobic ribonucleoside-triphosphate reductase
MRKKMDDWMVRTSDEGFERWNRRKIADALVREADLKPEDADRISREIEEIVGRLRIRILTAPLIRELVSVKLLQEGMETQHRLHARLGVPHYDVDRIMRRPNLRQGPFVLNPHGTSIRLAERVKTEYALSAVFSQEVVEAHLRGDIHLHGLGAVDRAAEHRQTAERLKRYGLRIPGYPAFAKPARHPDVLLAHLAKATAALFDHFSGGVFWDAVNFSFSPFLRGMKQEEIRQLAQRLLFDLCQVALGEGGIYKPLELGLWWNPPPSLRDERPSGPGGQPVGRSYGEFLPEARAFLQSLLETYREGDGSGSPFLGPDLHLYMDGEALENPILDLACTAAAEKGNIRLVLLRPGDSPASPDSVVFQNVSINLPRVGYQAGRDWTRLSARLAELMEFATRAHIQKRVFLEKLMSLGAAGPLSLLTGKQGAQPFFGLDASAHAIFPAGLNELTEIVTGAQLHESGEALAFGEKILHEMQRIVAELREKSRLNIRLSLGRDGVASHRFAALDLRFHSPLSGRYVKGEISENHVYYSSPALLNPDVKMKHEVRIAKESRLHPCFDGEVFSILRLESSDSAPAEVRDLVRCAYRETPARSLVFRRQFFYCASCGTLDARFRAACRKCGARALQAFSRPDQATGTARIRDDPF